MVLQHWRAMQAAACWRPAREAIASYKADNLTVDLGAGTAQVNGSSAFDTLIGFVEAQVTGDNDTLIGGNKRLQLPGG